MFTRIVSLTSRATWECAAVRIAFVAVFFIFPLFSLWGEKNKYFHLGASEIWRPQWESKGGCKNSVLHITIKWEKEISNFCVCHLWLVPYPFRKEEREASLICLQRAKRGGVRMSREGRVNRRERKEMALPLITTRCCDARFSVRQKRGRSLRDSSAAAHSPYTDLMIL